MLTFRGDTGNWDPPLNPTMLRNGSACLGEFEYLGHIHRVWGTHEGIVIEKLTKFTRAPAGRRYPLGGRPLRSTTGLLMATVNQGKEIAMELDQALKIVRAAGYRVTKPKTRQPANSHIQTVNPHGHAFPHAKLRNVTLTPITRLATPTKAPMIENTDVRNFAYSRAKELAEQFGYRAPAR